jgi:hypothetical protein
MTVVPHIHIMIPRAQNPRKRGTRRNLKSIKIERRILIIS